MAKEIIKNHEISLKIKNYKYENNVKDKGQSSNVIYYVTKVKFKDNISTTIMKKEMEIL